MSFLSKFFAGAGTGILGGLMSSSGASSARRFNAKEAQKQRDWQERMSNTAYQRAAKDLEAAGLNRILAFGSPSSTPSGGVASTNNNPGAEAFSAFMQSKRQAAEIENIEASTAKQKAEEQFTNSKNSTLQLISSVIPDLAKLYNENKSTFFKKTFKMLQDSARDAGMNLHDFKDYVTNNLEDGNFKRDILKVLDSLFNPKKSIGSKFLFGKRDRTFKD